MKFIEVIFWQTVEPSKGFLSPFVLEREVVVLVVLGHHSHRTAFRLRRETGHRRQVGCDMSYS